MTPETGTEIETAAAAADAARLRLADELDAYLDRHVVAPRLAAAIDHDRWGFRARFDEQWRPEPETSRFLVYQTLTAWTAAPLLERRPRWAATATAVARHGLATLERMRDPANGLYVHQLGLDGETGREADKHLYSQSFALLALAALGRAPGLGAEAERARALAEELFERIEERLRVGGPGGPGAYRRSVRADGSPIATDPRAVVPAADGLWGPARWVDLNSHLHLVEAYAELQRTRSRPAVAAAIESLLALFTERFYAAPGCLHLQLDDELRPVPGLVSYGHDIEAAELLLDAADTLGRPAAPALRSSALALAEHSLALGWDPHLRVWAERGGALVRGTDLACGWWVAFEALQTCSSFADRFPERREAFERGFEDTWDFVRNRLTDEENGGVWYGFDPRGHLLRHKSSDWFATYHAARALVASADRLRRTAR